jgi:cobalt-zinc-cadmium efflux system membrane fusion protein
MKNILKKYLSPVFAILIVILSIVQLSSAHDGEDHGAPVSNEVAPLGEPFFVSKESQFTIGIVTEAAAKRSLNFTVFSTGKVTPNAKGKADIYSPNNGNIIGNIPIVGNVVSRGRTLLTIRQTLALPEQLIVAGEKFKAQAEYEQALRDVERLYQLEGVVAQKEIIAAEIRLEAAEKTLNYYSSLLRGKNNAALNIFSIQSPISGVIVESNITAGEQIDPTKKLFTIVDINDLWVEANIYETDIDKLRNISEANLTVQTYPEEIFKAKLIHIGDIIDESTRTVKVIFSVINSGGLLKVGMFANLNIFTSNSSEVITVPKEAIVDVNGKNVVFIHSRPQAFTGKEVVLGRTDGKYVEIIKGIEVNDRVVTIGNYQLRASVN